MRRRCARRTLIGDDDDNEENDIVNLNTTRRHIASTLRKMKSRPINQPIHPIQSTVTSPTVRLVVLAIKLLTIDAQFGRSVSYVVKINPTN